MNIFILLFFLGNSHHARSDMTWQSVDSFSLAREWNLAQQQSTLKDERLLKPRLSTHLRERQLGTEALLSGFLNRPVGVGMYCFVNTVS
jgi:hypothetical protein